MIRKSLAFVLIGFVIVITGDAQVPAPGASGRASTFSMFFEGDGGYLGVEAAEVTRDNFAKYGLREVRGVAVDKVVEGSPAEKGGLQNGDVIVRFNADEVTSVRKLMRLIGEVSPDHEAKLTVSRAGSEREIVVTLGKRPMPKFDEGAFSMNMPRVPFPSDEFPPVPRMERMPRPESMLPPPGVPGQSMGWSMVPSRRIGISVSPLTKQLSEHFGVTGGVMINEVRADSPAAKSGLMAGDIIVEANGKEVKSEADVIRAIGEKKDGDVNLIIIRDRQRQTVRVTPEDVTHGTESYYIFPQPREPVAPRRSFWYPSDFPKLFPNGMFSSLRL